MLELFVLFLYLVALPQVVPLLLRAFRKPESAELLDDAPPSPLQRWLRPLVPTYRFFDTIEVRLSLGMRPLGSQQPFFPCESPPPRRLWFLFHNPDENLWLKQQSDLPFLLGRLSHPEFTRGARGELVRRAEEARDRHLPGEEVEFALCQEGSPVHEPLTLALALSQSGSRSA